MKTNHHKGQRVAKEYDFGKWFWQIRYHSSNKHSAGQKGGSKQKHIKEICSPSPEGVLFKKLAVSSKKEHMEQEI